MRVVCETVVAKTPGNSSRSFLYSVPLPTPEGPEITTGSVEGGCATQCQWMACSQTVSGEGV